MAFERKKRLGISIRRFAELAGVNESFVRERIKGGWLSKLPDGSLDPAQATGDWLPRNRRSAQPERHPVLERFVMSAEEWREIIQPQFGQTEADLAMNFEEACPHMGVDAETMLTWLRSGMPCLASGNWETGQGFLLSHRFMMDYVAVLDFLVTLFKDGEAARILKIAPGYSDRFQ